MSPRVLVLGIGNPLLADDGVGPRAAALLAGAPGLPPGTEVLDGGTGGLSLLPALEEAEVLIAIDAVDVGAAPGTLRRFAAHEIPPALGPALSPHEVGLRDLLALCRLRGTGPEEAVLWGVQVGRVGVGEALTAPVAAALPALVAAVREEAGKMSPPADTTLPMTSGNADRRDAVLSGPTRSARACGAGESPGQR